MKILSKIIPAVMGLILLIGCGKDNFDAPKSTLRGKIIYKEESINLRGTDEAIRLQLYQDGYAKHDPIEVFVTQDGSFSAKLFNGEYKLVTRDGNGPWVNKRDTMVIQVKGTTEVNLEVTPFFMISGEQISMSGTTLNASFHISQIVESANIDYAVLLISKTQFVDEGVNIFRKDFSDAKPGVVNLSGEIGDNKDVANAKALFARVGVRTKGADQTIYSTVVRLR